MGNEDHNPYAPPKARLAVAQQGEFWRDGKTLVFLRDAEFPDRCVKCNAPAVEPKKRYKLYWHHPGWYLLILLNIIIYAIVGAIVGKRATAEVGLCGRHKRRVLIGRILGWGGFTAIVAAVWVGLGYGIEGLWAAGLLAFLPWAIATVVVLRLIYATRIDKEKVKVKGCGSEFLDSLPEYPG
jgi:hypothetical protein